MTDNDELKNIPPMVPDRDDVDSYHSNRRSQGQEIVRPGYNAERVKVSTWPVRILLTLIVVVMGAAGYGAYYMYGEYEQNSRQAELRISDLERRLSLAGNSAEESALNLIDRLDFNFSEIDKLWAARRVINQGLEDVQSELSKLALANDGQNETTANNSQLIATTNQAVQASDGRLNSMAGEVQQITELVANLDAGVQELTVMQGDLESIRQALSSGDSTVLGLVGRLEYMEQSMESVNAHRLQINESLFRLQESIEVLQRPGGISAQ